MFYSQGDFQLIDNFHYYISEMRYGYKWRLSWNNNIVGFLLRPVFLRGWDFYSIVGFESPCSCIGKLIIPSSNTNGISKIIHGIFAFCWSQLVDTLHSGIRIKHSTVDNFTQLSQFPVCFGNPLPEHSNPYGKIVVKHSLVDRVFSLIKEEFDSLFLQRMVFDVLR